MKNNLLQTENILMQFGGVTAINQLSLEVKQGQITALIGPNGAGKTTAFNIITGVYLPTSGSIAFQEQTIIRTTPKKEGTLPNLHLAPDKITRLGIARTFQNIRLFQNLTVFENVLIAKHCRSKAGILGAMVCANHPEEHKMRAATQSLLQLMDLADIQNEIAGSLPYGQQRYLEIARALATEPKLLLLDEPAAGMNPQETQELTQFIRQIKDQFNLTVLMIEHHMDLVMEISDQIYVLDFGQTIAQGTPHQIQNDQRVIDAYLGVEEHA